MSEYNNNDVAMGWEDTIENDSEFVVLPEGTYDFEILSFERKRFEGSNKMSACPKAELSIRLTSNEGSTTVRENLLLNRKMEWKLCQFFTSIGLRKHGEPLRMNWNQVTGRKGKCKVIVDDYTNNKGEDREINRIDKFLEPSETPQQASQPKSFVPGQF